MRKTSRSGSNSSAKSPEIDESLLLSPVSSGHDPSVTEVDGFAIEDDDEAEVLGSDKSEGVTDSFPVADAQPPQRYFIMKSLTMQDMIQSVRSGIWATQRHNEEALNSAFKVYFHKVVVF